jgi:hypothetical protein
LGIKRREVWNDHIKLVSGLFNAVAIGVLAVAVIGPLAQPENPFFDFGDIASQEKVETLNLILMESPWYTLVQWPVAAMAIATHVVAQLILRLQIDV